MTLAESTGQSVAESARFRPPIGRAVPVTVVRLVIAAALLGLSFGVVGIQIWLAIALLLSIATLVFPRAPAAWLFAGLIALVSLGTVDHAPGWKLFVALAAVHLLHVIGTTLVWLPVGGYLQLRVLWRILRRFLIVQLPAQLVAYLVLNLLAGASGAGAITSPFFGLVAAVGLALLVVLVVSRRS